MKEMGQVLDASIVPAFLLLTGTTAIFVLKELIPRLDWPELVWASIGVIAVLVFALLGPMITPVHAALNWLWRQQPTPASFGARRQIVNGAALDIYFSSIQLLKNVSVEFLDIQKWRDGRWCDTQKFTPVSIDSVPTLFAAKEASIKRAIYGEMGYTEMTWFVRGSKVILDEAGLWRVLVRFSGFDEHKKPVPAEEISIEFELTLQDGHLMLKQ